MFSLSGFTISENLALIVIIITVLVCYMIGNISPAIIIGKMRGIDIRAEGSGNAGTTNVLRVLGKTAAAATLLIDIMKGVFAVFLGKWIGALILSPRDALVLGMICGFAAFIGHIWPLIFGFKGGKGVATALGIILTVDIHIGIAVAVIALLVIAFTRRVSAGSVAGAITFPLAVLYFNPDYIFWSLAMAIVVIVKHRGNILRLIKGTEPKFSFKK